MDVLDLSAAFNMVDHAILLLHHSYGFDGTVLHWFELYLCGQRQVVRRDSKASALTMISYGIPLGLVLRPILFILYTTDLMWIIKLHGLLPHLFADDTKVYDHCSLRVIYDLAAGVSTCTDEF